VQWSLFGGLAAMFFEESSPLSHIPVLRGIRPSMDIKRSDKFAGSEFGRA
jgi:hypothetical protein